MPDENVAAIPSRAGSVAVSVLFADPSRGLGEEAPAPACFRDLNLDQIVAAAMALERGADLIVVFLGKNGARGVDECATGFEDGEGAVE